jgi:hypothetical protein
VGGADGSVQFHDCGRTLERRYSLEASLDSEHRSQFVNRTSILKLLTDDEIARISRDEGAARLEDGDEYIDLGHLERGVCRAVGTGTPMRRVLPKKDIAEATWKEILSLLASHHPETPSNG